METYRPTARFAAADSVGYGGEKEFEQAVIPEHPGRQTVPSLAFSFFNPATHSYQTKLTAPLTVQWPRPRAAVWPGSRPRTGSPTQLLPSSRRRTGSAPIGWKQATRSPRCSRSISNRGLSAAGCAGAVSGGWVPFPAPTGEAGE